MANRACQIGPPPSRGRPRSAKRGAGFTLIEVVIAFLLLSVVLMTVFEIFSKGMSRAGELDDYAQALVVAQAQLATVGVEAPLTEGATAGESEDSRYRWAMTVTADPETTDPSRLVQGGYRLFVVEARVTWQSALGARDLSLSTLQIAQVK